MDESHLVKGREDVVRELNFRNGRGSGGRHSDAESSDALLAQGRVEDTVAAVLLLQKGEPVK